MAQNNDTNGWIEIDEVSKLQSLVDQSPIPFRLFANRFKSSSPDSEDFIHDPLGVLIQAETNGVIQGLGLNRDKWTVTTHVVNHHQTLSATHLYALVTANSDESSVGVTLVKKGS